MIKPLEEYSPEDRAFVEYVEHLRRQSPRPGFRRRSFTEQAEEQGIGPLNWEEIDAILRDADDETVDEPVLASR
jgi:hypothetical protein